MRRLKNSGQKKHGYFVDMKILDVNMQTVLKVKHAKVENVLDNFKKILEKYK